MYKERAKRSFPKALIPIHPRHDTRTQAAHRHDDIKYNRFFLTPRTAEEGKNLFFSVWMFQLLFARRWRCEVVFPCLECWLENQSAESWISCVADRVGEGDEDDSTVEARKSERKSTFYVFSVAGVRYMSILVFRLITRYHDTTLCALKSFFIKREFSAALAMLTS